jgi:hypothetical protein
MIGGCRQQAVLSTEVIHAFQDVIAGLLAPGDDELTTPEAARRLAANVDKDARDWIACVSPHKRKRRSSSDCQK